MRAFQFFNLNNQEDRQEFLTLASNFLDKLIGSDTRSDVDTRGIANSIVGHIANIFNNIFYNIFEIIAGLVETPCVFAKLIAADNELIGDACEFFQNLDE